MTNGNHIATLNEEIGRILGYYGFDISTHVNPYLGKEQNPRITPAHEGTHRDLCFYTSYGNIQLLLASIIRSNGEPVNIHFADVLQSTNECAWIAHEGCATFSSHLLLVEDFDKHVAGIREKLVPSYNDAFGTFLKIYKSAPLDSICKFTCSYVLFNCACAAMCAKDYWGIFRRHSEPQVLSALLRENGPDKRLCTLVEHLAQAESWDSVYESIRNTFNQLMGREVFHQGERLELAVLSEVDVPTITWKLNVCLRKVFSDVFHRLGIDVYTDGNDWHDERDALLVAWKEYFLNEGISVSAPLKFERTDSYSDDIHGTAHSRTKLDFEMEGPPSEKRRLPSKYLRLPSLFEFFKEELADEYGTVIVDIA